MASSDSPALQQWFTKPAPKFGKATREGLFFFDPEYTPLNHGGYGTYAKPIKDYYDELTLQIESQPDRFMKFDCVPLIAGVRSRIAQFIGAEADECLLVTNTSTALNTILRNFVWDKEDIIVTASTTYDSVSKTSQYLQDTPPHPQISNFIINFPTTHADMISSFRSHIQATVRSSTRTSSELTTGKGKIVAIIDGIISRPGVLLPWQEMTKLCREYGIWSVIDAAHCIGQEQGIDLGSSQPDFWVSNCHKWLLTKRSVAVMYVPKRNQHIIKSAIPTPHSYPGDLVTQYDWNGTIDWGVYLCVGACLDFRQWIGGEKAIYDYCHDLAVKGGKRIAEVMGTEVLDTSPNQELTCTMVNVILPLSLRGSLEIDSAFKKKLADRRAFGTTYYHNGKWMVRCSAQIYNEIEDFEKLGKVLLDICAEIEQEFAEKDGEKSSSRVSA